MLRLPWPAFKVTGGAEIAKVLVASYIVVHKVSIAVASSSCSLQSPFVLLAYTAADMSSHDFTSKK